MNSNAQAKIVGTLLLIAIAIMAFVLLAPMLQNVVYSIFDGPRIRASITGWQNKDNFFLKHNGGETIPAYDVMVNDDIIYSGTDWEMGTELEFSLMSKINDVVVTTENNILFSAQFMGTEIEIIEEQISDYLYMINPANNSNISFPYTFRWSKVRNATYYNLEFIDTNPYYYGMGLNVTEVTLPDINGNPNYANNTIVKWRMNCKYQNETYSDYTDYFYFRVIK